MPQIHYRTAVEQDIPAIAKLRTGGWGTEEYWLPRVTGYMAGTSHPQQALTPRIVFIATDGDKAAGFIAGHLTQRFNCQGELEWIDVMPQYRRIGVAAALLRLLAEWFVQQQALRVCVNAEPGNTAAQQFYTKFGAVQLNDYWLIWNDISTVLSNQ